MAKKHGLTYRGYKPNLSSSASSFAARGNPWVSRREGERDFGRQVEVENPDMDADRQRRKERERLTGHVDYKTTMAAIMETEFSTRVDGYQAPKARVKTGGWKPGGRKPGVDFVVEKKASDRQRLTNIALRMKRNMRVPDAHTARVVEHATVSCPRGCGFSNPDSRIISRHLRQYANSCCTHVNCNCDDCRRARNEVT